MVLSKIQVSQNFCEISRSLKFLQGIVSDYRSRSRILQGKKSWARKEKRQSRHHA